LEERERKGRVDHWAEFVWKWNTCPWRTRGARIPEPRRLRRLLASARPKDAGPHVRPRARVGHRRRCTRGPPASDLPRPCKHGLDCPLPPPGGTLTGVEAPDAAPRKRGGKGGNTNGSREPKP
jgi:hypothetical protein